MYLYLMQHAKANTEEVDQEERLTDAGKKCAEKMGAVLAKLKVSPDWVIVSPKKRSKETATLVMKQLGLLEDRLKETEAIKAKTEAKEMISFLQSLGKVSSLLVVGHLPSLAQLAKAIAGVEVVFQNGGCLCIEIEELGTSLGKVCWLVPPEVGYFL